MCQGKRKKSLQQRNPSGIELLAEDRASSVISAWQMLGSYRHRMQRTPSERSQPVFALDAARADVLLYSVRKKEPFHTRLSPPSMKKYLVEWCKSRELMDGGSLGRIHILFLFPLLHFILLQMNVCGWWKIFTFFSSSTLHHCRPRRAHL